MPNISRKICSLAPAFVALLSIPATAQQAYRMCTAENGRLKPDIRRTVVITQKENPEVFANDAFSLSRAC
jgi:hypothetical protein